MVSRHSSRRESRERRTLEAMVRVYCRDVHGGSRELCEDCQGLVDYAFERIERCPWGEDKPTCAQCAIHCYRSQEREAIRERMRHSGPRMLTRHPVLAIQHLIDKRRAADLESLAACRARRRQQSEAP